MRACARVCVRKSDCEGVYKCSDVPITYIYSPLSIKIDILCVRACVHVRVCAWVGV